ncbi:glycosyltransferase [Nocardia seriolae]|uniref:Glycosyltransferase n=1 Tax=Nocardia seriolae TaxID=37332 RepID=A0ABC8ATN1_9NOCA|nr:nucleotide disphospho-sugar-binding domain-containing protein [Nocardia seriolae]APA97583.1 TDP-daunosamine transferase DnrS [Nocardia seriolae]OJF81484.1 hypothetical protein NS14008_22755 [Nocardia seriolae]QUN18030.1 hypothetical protein KEC46_00600 [Nocardia seriolae]WKY50298.1 glycosyltransferase [Nocardia seriolae]WNJ61717.1 glycosyltransferase [Nocardia seriolae]
MRPLPVPEADDRVRLPGIPASRPLIYLTLGTVFGTRELLTEAIAGLARLDAHVIVAAGRLDPDEVGPAPGNVSVHGWVPQAGLLSHADVVVHHGGSGTALGALSSAVPQLLLPQGADQFANADAVEAAGAGIRLADGDIGADAIADAAQRLPQRRGNDYRAAAEAIAGEIARMPGPDEVVDWLREVPRGR